MIKKVDKVGLVGAKFGSNCVVGNGGIDERRIFTYAEKLGGVYERATGLFIVTSGAVAKGKSELDIANTKENQQIFASAGSTAIVECWKEALYENGIQRSGGVFVTHREIDSPEGDVLLKFHKLAVSLGYVGIYNENDALSVEELKKLAYGGDNDGLASHLAIKYSAEHLLIFTDGVDGLHDNNGKLVKEVNASRIETYKNLCIGQTNDGSGGMFPKLEAGANAFVGGVGHVAIAGSHSDYEQIVTQQTDQYTKVVQ